MKKKIAVFVSGSGTDLQSIIDGVKSGMINGEIAMVIASRPDIFAIERARANNIPSKVFMKADYPSVSAMYDDIIALLIGLDVDLIVLAGYLSILSENIVKAYRGKIINIHPSLIPKHCGAGYYGIRVHRSVIEAGDTESGATIHYVDEGTDTGKIIRQEKVPVLPDDTAETLAARVLKLEHIILPEVVRDLCAE